MEGVDGNALDQTDAMATRRLRSLDSPPASNETSRGVSGEEDPIAHAVERNALSDAVAELSESERQVLFEYFIKGFTPSQIAADHDVSQMQVSRWITAALRRLRNLLE